MDPGAGGAALSTLPLQGWLGRPLFLPPPPLRNRMVEKKRNTHGISILQPRVGDSSIVIQSQNMYKNSI